MRSGVDIKPAFFSDETGNSGKVAAVFLWSRRHPGTGAEHFARKVARRNLASVRFDHETGRRAVPVLAALLAFFFPVDPGRNVAARFPVRVATLRCGLRRSPLDRRSVPDRDKVDLHAAGKGEECCKTNREMPHDALHIACASPSIISFREKKKTALCQKRRRVGKMYSRTRLFLRSPARRLCVSFLFAPRSGWCSLQQGI